MSLVENVENVENHKSSLALNGREVETKPYQARQTLASKGARKLTLEDKLFLVKITKDKISHINIDQTKCRECTTKVCLTVCPANTYEEMNGEIKANYENCLECGSCRLACKKGAIDWENPRGGFGVTYSNG
ncbi:MAG: 4Fe-4S dicluster domain-containing protein [Candidatus Omnitrophota bacterium]|nr:MAG: 4Fe-4S dicluster domain-containing protein [Candidatus Omnitrophota bacterium]